ncbi:MAG: helix-turn-helix domain-containing protein [Elusimicrobiota bacterium]
MPRRYAPNPISTSRILTRFLQWAEHAPEGASVYSTYSLIQLTRKRLGMTQAQLAKRCGLPQSHIANIETGKVDIQLETLRRIFKALRCRLVVAPQPIEDLKRVMWEQAGKLARKRVARVAGTMAMEKQRPDDDMLEDLVRAETEKLLQERSSEIWDAE